MPTVLAIETSCDETAAAVLRKEGDRIDVLANTVHSQASLHAKWGGVVPNLASREHLANIVPVLEETLERAGLSPRDLDALAVTAGPGLMPALIVGVNAAKTLSLVWQKPLLGIQHLEGHIYANALAGRPDLAFPLLALVVSGGHTELVLMRGHFQYEILGATIDDAAGEAFDKVAKILGLPYPGGPEVARRADAFRESEPEEALAPLRTLFPRPLGNTPDYQFSFSGLKTAVLYEVKKAPEAKRDASYVASMCYAFQEAAVDVLVKKTERALREYAPETFVIAGGVSANVTLRTRLETLLRERFPETVFRMPPFEYSLDNAAMIGTAALFRYEHLGDPERSALRANATRLAADPNLPL
jgi:N6-L-threonylcarbamoyladenine synthase